MIDLHAHTTCSDGTFSPEALVELAARRGLSALAVTDHDTMLGLDRAASRAADLDIRFVPGIELEIMFIPGEFHLLGLGLFHPGEEFASTLTFIDAKRVERNFAILERIREAGVAADMDEVQAIAGGTIVGRPHFASLLVQRKFVKTKQLAFTKYLAKGRPFYVGRETVPLEKAIDLIHASGGRAILAHPLSLFLSWGKLQLKLNELKEIGIDGIEAYHPTATLNACRRLETMGRNLGFMITAGSDFHGENRPDRKLGITAGDRKIEDSFLDGLELDFVERPKA
jgi:3',5'-nucleoside bisphosphate phosphatase